eukprot:2143877-Rhodomonas_salina.2
MNEIQAFELHAKTRRLLPAQRGGSAHFVVGSMSLGDPRLMMQREDSYESNGAGDEGQGALPKWRRRNLQHHLAGERRRRQSRKARVMQLGELLPNVGKDAALNRVLECAVASVRAIL